MESYSKITHILECIREFLNSFVSVVGSLSLDFPLFSFLGAFAKVKQSPSLL